MVSLELDGRHGIALGIDRKAYKHDGSVAFQNHIKEIINILETDHKYM